MFNLPSKPLLYLTIIIVLFGVFGFYIQQKKKDDLLTALTKVEITDIKTAPGISKGKAGTAIFGTIHNNGERIIKIATMNVAFYGKDGEVVKTHKFFPVNNFSFSDSLPLAPGNSKEFGFPIDDIVPEDWSGSFATELTDLKFK